MPRKDAKVMTWLDAINAFPIYEGVRTGLQKGIMEALTGKPYEPDRGVIYAKLQDDGGQIVYRQPRFAFIV